MQEIKKTRIVIASVLKPVDDTRMFEKMGQSLAPFYDVHIIGYPTARRPAPGIATFHPLTPFRRLSTGRFKASWKIFLKILQLRPGILIINTHELLLAASVLKIIRGIRVIYDVRENYWRNIVYTDTFPAGLKIMIASWVKMKEWIARPFIDHYFLAETAYQHEMNFPQGRFTILQNKFRKPATFQAPRKSRQRATIQLLFSGTIAASTGVFTAIELTSALYALNPRIRLTIMGYCAMPETREALNNILLEKPFISFTGGEQLVPHTQILEAIHLADYGIIAYPPNPSTDNTIPTKLYEYVGSQLPVLLINHPAWVRTCEIYNAAIVFDPGDLQPGRILHQMEHETFYTTPPRGVFWEDEAPELLKTLQNLSAP
jgi:hypothetical protein